MTKKTKRERDEATVREWEDRWTSVKKWLETPVGEREREIGGKITYIRHLKRRCRITGLNPDQLAAVEFQVPFIVSAIIFAIIGFYMMKSGQQEKIS